MSYIPEVNDYVLWNKGIEGWVYFKDVQYITIESNVRPKDDVNYEASPFHANNRLLIICFKDQWKELTYIRSRKSVNEQ